MRLYVQLFSAHTGNNHALTCALYKIVKFICYVRTAANKQIAEIMQDRLAVVIKEQEGQ